MAFRIAVGATSLVCHVLVTPMPDRQINRRPSAGRGSYFGDDGGSHPLNWFGIGHSAPDSSVHSG